MRAGAAAIKAAIIDLDGTMLDTVPDFEAALNGMRAEFGLGPITQATIKPMVGKGSEKLVRDALLLDWDAARVDAIHADAMAAYQRHYLAINGDRSTLFDGVVEGLEAMRAHGLRLVCVTNKPVAFTLPYYLRFADALRERAKQLGGRWTPVLVERALWAHSGGKAALRERSS